MATTESEVEQFLSEFRTKMGTFTILFRNDRQKNMQCFADLEITQSFAEQTIDGLQVVDYCEGPLDEKLYGLGDMWVFGKDIKKREVYIKITKGHPGSQVICVSFHVAERPMNYPFKSKKS